MNKQTNSQHNRALHPLLSMEGLFYRHNPDEQDVFCTGTTLLPGCAATVLPVPVTVRYGVTSYRCKFCCGAFHAGDILLPAQLCACTGTDSGAGTASSCGNLVHRFLFMSSTKNPHSGCIRTILPEHYAGGNRTGLQPQNGVTVHRICYFNISITKSPIFFVPTSLPAALTASKAAPVPAISPVRQPASSTFSTAASTASASAVILKS